MSPGEWITLVLCALAAVWLMWLTQSVDRPQSLGRPSSIAMTSSIAHNHS